MGLVSDEHYDRLHAERVAAGLVDGKRSAKTEDASLRAS